MASHAAESAGSTPREQSPVYLELAGQCLYNEGCAQEARHPQETTPGPDQVPALFTCPLHAHNVSFNKTMREHVYRVVMASRGGCQLL